MEMSVSDEPEHRRKTAELRTAMVRASDDADVEIRRALVCALALGHSIDELEPLRQALGWLAKHAIVTANTYNAEEVIEGVLP